MYAYSDHKSHLDRSLVGIIKGFMLMHLCLEVHKKDSN